MDMEHEHEQEMEHKYAPKQKDVQESVQKDPSYTTIEAQLGELSTTVEDIYLAVDARFNQMIHLM